MFQCAPAGNRALSGCTWAVLENISRGGYPHTKCLSAEPPQALGSRLQATLRRNIGHCSVVFLGPEESLS